MRLVRALGLLAAFLVILVLAARGLWQIYAWTLTYTPPWGTW